MIKELSKQLQLSEEKTKECFNVFLKQLHFLVYKEKYLPNTLVSVYSELEDDGLLNYWAIVENVIRKTGANDDFILDWSYRLGNLYASDESLNLEEYFATIKRDFDTKQ
ncbi:MAG: hypothetical protein IPP31_04045 [Chitinophagaceae bacterium]|nr:hypothetical protein [Chitinophagaceae bacterium]